MHCYDKWWPTQHSARPDRARLDSPEGRVSRILHTDFGKNTTGEVPEMVHPRPRAREARAPHGTVVSTTGGCLRGPRPPSWVPGGIKDREGGSNLWRGCVARADKVWTFGGRFGGQAGGLDGCSSTTRRRARPMPNGSGDAPGAVRRSNARTCFPRLSQGFSSRRPDPTGPARKGA
jgi:hypothetical protein